jgi:hypothetical protein
METIQQQIGALQTSVKRQRFAIVALAGIIVAGGFVAAVRPAGDATFDTITCKGWKVVDADGKLRIVAGSEVNGKAGVVWVDKEGKQRIMASTFSNQSASVQLRDTDEKMRISTATYTDGEACVGWLDKDGKVRISASTKANGFASVGWLDKDEKMRISAGTFADGNVVLPTEDAKNLNSPKKP